MILVLLGTQKQSFERLLREIDMCIEKGSITEEVLVQAGNTKYKSTNMKIFDYISKDELEEIKKRADLIITHGGVGSILSSIKLNKKVLAVPRLKKYKEHINDHQLQIVKNFDNQGYIKGIIDIEKLQEELKNINSFIPKKYVENNSKITNIIDEYIKNH